MRQDGRPARVADEGGMVADAELVGQQAEVIDVGFVGAGVTDGTHEDQFWLGEGGRGGVLLPLTEEAGERTQDQRVVFLGPELGDIKDDGFPAALRVLIDREQI